MATEVHSIPASSNLLQRRSGSRLQLLSEHPNPLPADAPIQNKDEATHSSHASLTTPFKFTPLTPILASPVLTPAITTVSPSNSASSDPIIPHSNSIHGSGGGVRHQRSRSTLSRLHVTLPDDYFDARRHIRSATLPTFPEPFLPPGCTSGTPPSPRLLNDIIIVDGIPIAKTPSPAEETPLPTVDFPTTSSRVSSPQNMPRSRSRPARKSFMLGSDDEDDTPEQQKREAAAKAKKLEKYDNLRRYNALMELLKTEAKYLQDLRILVNVYLQQLQHAVTSRSISSYFGSSASCSKQTASPSPTFGSTQTPGQPANPSPSPVQLPSTIRRSAGASDRVEVDKDLQFNRPIFTEDDIQLLCRNSNEILTFHERFVDDLKEALTPLGSKFRFDDEDEYAYVDMPRHDILELAIQIIVSMFVDRVESFKLYKFFCSTHSEAVELVQRAKRVSSADWEAWEKRCRKCLLDNYRCELPPAASTSAAIHFVLDDDPSPRPQGKSIARSQTEKNNRPRSFVSSKPPRANTAPPHLTSSHRHHSRGQNPRLEFLDQMIKPVQRICKYHLLLDQLKSRVSSHPHSNKGTEGDSRSSRHNPRLDLDGTFDPANLLSAGQTESLVTHACEAMREVVNSVNDHRRKHEDRWKAFLIASRTVTSSAASSSSLSYSQLTSEVLMTLGNCLMCGALDVIYHRPTTSSTTKAKYLGAFLYEQGYLALVKVGKGKTYEPQHWFLLKDFDVLDSDDEDGSFPYSFHLTGCGHNFQFAAACQREKEVWMECLRNAAVAAAEYDTAELPSSLLDENKEEVFVTPSVTIHDVTEGLPTIQSETENLEELLASRPGNSKVVSDSRALSDDGHSVRTDPRPHSQPVSRRGSSNSVRAIFSPFLFDSAIRLVRPTPVQRHLTDQGLSDVFSNSCRDARNLAMLQGQELFQLPRPILRSRSGVAVPGLRGRKESRIFNRRSYGGLPVTSLSLTSANSTPSTMDKKVKHKERPSSVMFPQSWLGEDSTSTPTFVVRTDNQTSSSEEGQVQGAPPEATTSLCSSEAASNVGSTLGSSTEFKPSALGSPYVQPNTLELPPEACPDVHVDYRPKRSRSMVDNVKSFFSSPSKRLSRTQFSGTDLLADSLSFGRGTRNPPTSYPNGPSEPPLPSVTVHPVDVDADTPPSDRSRRPPAAQGRNSTGDLGRKRSLFMYGRRGGTDVSRLSAMSTVSATSSTTEASGSSVPLRRRSVKDILLHFRTD